MVTEMEPFFTYPVSYLLGIRYLQYVYTLIRPTIPVLPLSKPGFKVFPGVRYVKPRLEFFEVKVSQIELIQASKTLEDVLVDFDIKTLLSIFY